MVRVVVIPRREYLVLESPFGREENQLVFHLVRSSPVGFPALDGGLGLGEPRDGLPRLGSLFGCGEFADDPDHGAGDRNQEENDVERCEHASHV